MEREISTSVSIAITLVGVAALISLVFVYVAIGKDIQNSAGQGLIGVKSGISDSFLRDLANSGGHNEMPTATAHNIIMTYEDIISDVVCGYNGEVTNPLTQGSCLADNLKGRVQLEVHEVNGAFVIFVHHENSTWHSGVENGNTLGWDSSGFYEVKAKYNLQTVW